MGKGTDKLYITHSEWASADSFSATSGFRAKTQAPYKRLPFNFCALSLQPFTNPVCTPTGTIFELTHIIPWLKKHGTDPVTGEPLSYRELLKLTMHRNEDGEFCDPVTFKVFTDNTHIVALRTSGNVFAWDTVERLNVRPKLWRDLLSDDEFSRKDIVTLQDPHNLAARDMAAFKYLQEGTSTLTDEQEAERKDPLAGINVAATGSSAKILAANASVAKARARRAEAEAEARKKVALGNSAAGAAAGRRVNPANQERPALPYNAAVHTTGKAAASLTSTSLTPHVGAERALLSDEEYMLKVKRVKIKGYARIATNLGNLNVELNPEWAPKAVYNFVKLAQQGYYKGVKFHRNIRSFMIQGGDPTGTGRGGTSYWTKPFADELEGPLVHDSRGILSMANKGKNTNTSQFFILYRPARHLDRKHTIFGKVVGGLDVLDRMETAPVAEGDVPVDDIVVREVVVFVDPFEEFLKKRGEEEGRRKDEGRKRARGQEEEGEEARVTWTGKRLRADGGGGSGGSDGGGKTESAVGKYLKQRKEPLEPGEDEVVGEVVEDDIVYEEPKKKPKPRAGGGFGDFSSW